MDTGLKSYTFTVGVKENVCPPQNRENDKIQLSLPVTPLHFWIILLQNAHNFDLK